MKNDFRYIEIHLDGPLARINLDRPEQNNALTLDMIAELDKALDEISEMEELLFVVLSGNGRSFCAGVDLNWFSGAEERSLEENAAQYKQLADVLLKLFQLPQITIANVHGNVFGGGIGLMAACDFVLAEANARFMFSEVKLGLLPAIILPFVAKRLSVQNLRKWILTGSLFHTQEAGRAGLVDVVCSDGQPENTLLEFIASFDMAAPSAVKMTKKMINQVANGKVGLTDTELTATILAEAVLSHNGQIGIHAFLEKRKKPLSNLSPKGKGLGNTDSENLNI
ncbi:MAG: enoyl-CoA hydratase-related protein [Bacteroidota bacterium]|nr:enoyl-CoA hydratase-related protein [Bacteroidota bacterium]